MENSKFRPLSRGWEAWLPSATAQSSAREKDLFHLKAAGKLQAFEIQKHFSASKLCRFILQSNASVCELTSCNKIPTTSHRHGIPKFAKTSVKLLTPHEEVAILYTIHNIKI